MTNLLDNELFSVLELGTKGCVTERDAKLECFETNAEYFGLSLLTGYRKTFL